MFSVLRLLLSGLKSVQWLLADLANFLGAFWQGLLVSVDQF